MENEALEIAKLSNYLCPTRYISGRIIEFDIRSANISCYRQADILSQEEYIRLSKLPKMQREIEVGLMERADPKLYTIKSELIKQARNFLVYSNNIEARNIVRIANDAVYVNTHIDLRNLKYTDYIEFRPKSINNVYLRLSNNLIFFISFMQDGNLDIDVKGVKNIEFHQDFVSIISYTVAILERAGIEEACRYLQNTIEDYLKYNLPVGCYKEFYSDGGYRFANYPMAVSKLNDEDKYLLDINYNYNILRELWSILFEIYTMRRH